MSSTEPSASSSNAAPHRYFCHPCSITVIIDPSAGFDLLCPICRGALIQHSNLPSSSSSSSTTAANLPAAHVGSITRYASFERRHPTHNFIHVISEPGFFTSPYPNARPILPILPTTESYVSFGLIKRFIENCIKEGATINCIVLQHEPIPLSVHPQSSPHSAHPSTIAALPDFQLTEELLASGDLQCSICLENFKMGEEAKKLPCEHLYHKNCIVSWLEKSNSCPVCRFELKSCDLSYEQQSPTGDSQPAVSGDAREETAAGDGERGTAERFNIELRWPIGSNDGQRNSNSGRGNDASDLERFF